MPPKRWKNLALACLVATVLCAGATSGSESEENAPSRTPAARAAPEQLALNRAPADGVPDGVDGLVTGSDDSRIFEWRVLGAHNREREALGLAPLRWNPALAQSARKWADHLAATGRFEHAPENHAAPEGENLWAGTKGYYTPEAMVQAWIREKKFFRPGTFPDNSVTGRVEDVGHYTQLVWRATREVGCATARGGAEDILVCRYAEAGNWRGEKPF